MFVLTVFQLVVAARRTRHIRSYGNDSIFPSRPPFLCQDGAGIDGDQRHTTCSSEVRDSRIIRYYDPCVLEKVRELAPFNPSAQIIYARRGTCPYYLVQTIEMLLGTDQPDRIR